MVRDFSIYKLKKIDWLMSLAVLVLIGLGVLFIYSACYRSPDLPVNIYYKKQIVWGVLGFAAYLVLAAFDYRRLNRQAYWVYAVSLLLLVVVLLVGTRVNGAARWLSVFGFQLQPSELAKLTVVIALARFLARPGRNLEATQTIGRVLLMVGVPFLLIVKEPDLGTAVVLIPITLAMMYVAGVPLKKIMFLSMIGLAFLPLAWFALGDYQQERILVFFDPGRDPLGAGWNKIQSEIAVGSGGLTGKGFLKGTQNILGFLPRTVAPTDFIYSVIAEETGFMGSVFILALFCAIFIAGLRAVLWAPDKFGALLAVGVMMLLFSHVFVNMAMTIGLMPITGLPLPLISYGGSFMVITMIALGIVQSVYVRRISH